MPGGTGNRARRGVFGEVPSGYRSWDYKNDDYVLNRCAAPWGYSKEGVPMTFEQWWEQQKEGKLGDR